MSLAQGWRWVEKEVELLTLEIYIKISIFKFECYLRESKQLRSKCHENKKLFRLLSGRWGFSWPKS